MFLNKKSAYVLKKKKKERREKEKEKDIVVLQKLVIN